MMDMSDWMSWYALEDKKQQKNYLMADLIVRSRSHEFEKYKRDQQKKKQV